MKNLQAELKEIQMEKQCKVGSVGAIARRGQDDDHRVGSIKG
jgi:hypothetical protein